MSVLMHALSLGLAGPVLRPSQAGWDSSNVANPVVLLPRPDVAGDPWRLFYYGSDGTWANPDVQPFLPTGKCGLATSADGCSWTRVQDAPIFEPGPAGSWDSLHVGVGDVHWSEDGQSLVMYYLGANDEVVTGGPPVKGIRMRIGRAISADGGLSWTREPEPVLDCDASEGLFASWPRVLPPESTGGPWQMSYHSFDGSCWKVFSAKSDDGGQSWAREGLAIGPGGEGRFDSQGCGTRCLVRQREGVLMIYEGVEAGEGTHRLGAALSTDGGLSFSKLDEVSPLLAPGGAGGPWTAQVVGTPFAVALPGGGLRLYFCGKPTAERGGMCIGAVESASSNSGEIGTQAWRAVGGAAMADI